MAVKIPHMGIRKGLLFHERNPQPLPDASRFQENFRQYRKVRTWFGTYTQRSNKPYGQRRGGKIMVSEDSEKTFHNSAALNSASGSASVTPGEKIAASDTAGNEDTAPFADEAVAEQESELSTECCCGPRHKKRTPEEQKALITRLKRIEGQIRGIEKMVENDAYCPDILIQVSAATSALNSFNKTLLGCHIRGCVAQDIRDGRNETIDELCNVLQKLMK